MKFQAEYDILTSLKTDRIVEIAFHFRDHHLKLYFAKKPEYEFLTLVCESITDIFVKNYAVYFDNDVAQIDIYWRHYFTYAIGLRDQHVKYSQFDDFKLKLREAIKSIKHPSHAFTVSFLPDTEGIKRIHQASVQSRFPEEPIYFYYVKRQSTQSNYNEALNVLGKEIATKLVLFQLTVVFTADITKQKSLILDPTDPNLPDLHTDNAEQEASLSHL